MRIFPAVSKGVDVVAVPCLWPALELAPVQDQPMSGSFQRQRGTTRLWSGAWAGERRDGRRDPRGTRLR